MEKFVLELLQLLHEIRKSLYIEARKKDEHLATLLEGLNQKTFEKVSFKFYHQKDKDLEALWDLYIDTQEKIKELLNKSERKQNV